MNNKTAKFIAKTFLLLFVLGSLSSCSQKGYGCPMEFKAPVNIVLPFIK